MLIQYLDGILVQLIAQPCLPFLFQNFRPLIKTVKFLFKIALLILTARVLAGTPRGSSKEIDAIGDFSLRDIARGVTSAVAKAEGAVLGFWQDSTPAAPKAAARHSTGARRPANSF